jgi:hypothetical protein
MIRTAIRGLKELYMALFHSKYVKQAPACFEDFRSPPAHTQGLDPYHNLTLKLQLRSVYIVVRTY